MTNLAKFDGYEVRCILLNANTKIWRGAVPDTMLKFLATDDGCFIVRVDDDGVEHARYNFAHVMGVEWI